MMHWNWKYFRRALKILVAVLIVLVPAGQVTRARLAGSELLAPLSRVVPSRAEGIALPDDPEGLKRLVLSLRLENEKLRATNKMHQDRVAQINQEIRRLRQFRRLAEKLRLPRSRAVSARVLRRGVNWNAGTILIDRGTGDGIEAGCGVLAGPNVMGLVMEAGRTISRVALLPRRGVQISARIIETRQTGMVSGANGAIELRYVGADRPRADHPRPAAGQAVVTAGLDGVFPPGVFIGSISAARRPAGDIFFRIEINPAARAREVESVIVLRREHLADLESMSDIDNDKE